jgi:hypothetical protein
LGPGGLHRLWKNNADDTMMISSGMPYSSGIQWSASRRIPGVTSETPSLVSF